ncbi:MAG TPA: MATE family efflux transporter [Treponemataceae bacterium]|jgi:putative MATE family efflux protein|nr:MATE family efflux transporter [Treponemataceae bacterium]
MHKENSRIAVLAETPVLKAIVTMALPVMLGMIVQVLYNLVDTFFIGLMNDVSQLAAANLGFPYFMITMAVGSVIGVGASSAISRFLGMKKNKEAGETAGLSMILVVLAGAAFTVFGLIFLEPLLFLLGARGEVLAPTREYLFPLILGASVIMANFSVGVTLRAEGAALETTIGMIAGSIVNIVLDPIMIFTLDMGIAGAAWATIIGNLVGLGWYLWCYKRKSILKLSFGANVWNPDYIRQIFTVGVPAGLNQVLMSVSNIVSNNLAASYGASVLASIGIAAKTNSLGILLLVGLSTGCQPLFGYNYGAKNRKRLVSLLTTGIILAFSLGLVMVGFYTATSRFLVSIFSNNSEVITTGRLVLTAMSSSAPLIGVIMMVMNSLQAFGKALPALILSTGRQGLFYLPLLFTLNALFGLYGFIFAQPVTDVIMAILATLMLVYILKTDPALKKAPGAEAVN